MEINWLLYEECKYSFEEVSQEYEERIWAVLSSEEEENIINNALDATLQKKWPEKMKFNLIQKHIKSNILRVLNEKEFNKGELSSIHVELKSKYNEERYRNYVLCCDLIKKYNIDEESQAILYRLINNLDFWNIAVDWKDLNTSTDKEVSIWFRSRGWDNSYNVFMERVALSLQDKMPVEFISTVCPSFSYNENWEYDFKDMSSSVWLLSKIHLSSYENILKPLKEEWIGYSVKIVVADLAEWYDDSLIDRYCEWNIESYYSLIDTTISETQAIAWENIEIVSMSDLYKENMDTYKERREELNGAIIEQGNDGDAEFSNFYWKYREARLWLIVRYAQSEWKEVDDDYINKRCANWISQYIDHFSRLRAISPEAVIVNHDTWWLNLVNSDMWLGIASEKTNWEFPIIVLDTKIY